jgi:hypothetical protein
LQKELLQSIEELQTELTKYAGKHSEYAPLNDDDVVKAASASKEGGLGFGNVIEQVLSDQEAKGKTFAGKVESFVRNLFPIAGLVLGIVSLSADVRSRVRWLRIQVC